MLVLHERLWAPLSPLDWCTSVTRRDGGEYVAAVKLVAERVVCGDNYEKLGGAAGAGVAHDHG
jgi:hypothetical protein